MSYLENRIPPPLVAIAVAAAMWFLARFGSAVEIAIGVRLAAAGLVALVGLAVMGLGVGAFGRARTTLNPVKIDTASALVTDGIFAHTRNPMYLGMTIILLAWAVYLAAPWSLIGPVAFVLFMTRFQIVPEERVLAAKFTSAYLDYTSKVRRWV